MVISYPTLQQYWCRSWPFPTSTFSSIMPRDCFLLILKFLHLTNNNNQIPLGHPEHDWLFILRSFMTALITCFKLLYRPHKEISVDESMISYKGRLSFLQYIPKKPKKWEMKAWVLVDSKIAYTWSWYLYSRKEQNVSADSLATQVVLRCRRPPQYESSCLLRKLYTSPGM